MSRTDTKKGSAYLPTQIGSEKELEIERKERFGKTGLLGRLSSKH
jgi:hypothetical protein